MTSISTAGRSTVQEERRGAEPRPSTSPDARTAADARAAGDDEAPAGRRGRRAGRLALAGWSFLLILVAAFGLSAAGVTIGFGVAACVLFGWLYLIFTLVRVVRRKGRNSVPLRVLAAIAGPFVMIAAGSARLFATIQRRAARPVRGAAITSPYWPPDSGRWTDRVRAAIGRSAFWRDLSWLLIDGVGGIVLCVLSLVLFLGALWLLVFPAVWFLTPEGMFAVPLPVIPLHDQASSFYTVPAGIVLAVLWWSLGPLLLRLHARFAHVLLAPTERTRLALRVSELTASRAETVDAQAAEIRRIERDLHDGAQARIVALGMSLGLAEELVRTDPKAAAELLNEARESTTLALSELRSLVRGIHPPVLADRGLDGAVRALALTVGRPVDVDIVLAGRPPAPVETAAYFAVCEAVANAGKYAPGVELWIRVRHADGRLRAVVGDHGPGGAAVSEGGGLAGVRRRLASFDGTLTLSSPPGGPTIVTLELPCVLSSART